jgi:drug/metabolite transporter (DMT)-like permease
VSAPATTRARARLELFGSAACFGLMAVLTRAASLSGFGAGQLATVRFALGVAATVAWFGIGRGTFMDTRRRTLLVRGLAGGVAVVLYFVSLALIPAGEATLLNNLYPVFTTILAIFTLGERPTAHLWVALALTTAGVVLALDGGAMTLRLGWGELAGIGSSLFGATAVTAIRAARLPGGSSPPANTATVFFALSLGGLIVSWPFALTAWPVAFVPWAYCLGAALVALVAQLLMTHSLGFLAIPEASVWQQLAPVMSYLWAAALLSEAMSATTVVGVAIAGAGVVYGAVFGSRRQPLPVVNPLIARDST